MEAKIIIAIQNIGSNWLDKLMVLITRMGEELFFLCFFAFIYLCISKKQAIYFGLLYCFSAIINSVVKVLIRRPRPYIDNSKIIDKYGSSGYSMPSGHSQAIAVTSIGCYSICKSRIKRPGLYFGIMSIIVVLVGFSRIYLGQHYVTDVIAGILLAVLCFALFTYLIKYVGKLNINLPRLMLILGLVSLLVLGIVFVAGNRTTSMYKYLSMFCGVAIGYFLEDKYINYQPNTKHIWSKLLIVIPTILLTRLILFYLINNAMLSMSISYFIIAILATYVLPYLFTKVWREK